MWVLGCENQSLATESLEWPSKVEGSKSKAARELGVELSVVAQGQVAANIASELTGAGISNVDATAKGWVDGKATVAVGVKLGSHVDGGVDGVVIANLDIGRNSRVDLASGRVNIQGQLWSDRKVSVATKDIEGHESKRQGLGQDSSLATEVVLVVDSRELGQEPLLCNETKSMVTHLS